MAGILVVISMLTAGCWDMRELQNRHLVVAVGIDAAPPTAPQPTETFAQPYGSKRYRLSLQIVKFGGGNSSGGEDGRIQDQTTTKTFVIANTGQSMFEMVRDMMGRTSKTLYFEHLQTIIISEEAVRLAGLSPIIDFFRRDPEMRWRVSVYLTPGSAAKILEFNPPTGEPGGVYLHSIARNQRRSGHIGTLRNDLGFISQAMDNKDDVRIPAIVQAEDTVKLTGLALFKQTTFAGYVDEHVVQGLRIIDGSLRSAVIAAPCPEHPDNVLVFELYRHKTKLRPHVDGDNIYFTLDINMRGNLGEASCSFQHKTFEAEYVARAETIFAQEIKKMASAAFSACQQLGVDAVRFGKKLRAYEPETWNKVKDNWREIYLTIPMQVSANVTISNMGSHQ